MRNIDMRNIDMRNIDIKKLSSRICDYARSRYHANRALQSPLSITRSLCDGNCYRVTDRCPPGHTTIKAPAAPVCSEVQSMLFAVARGTAFARQAINPHMTTER